MYGVVSNNNKPFVPQYDNNGKLIQDAESQLKGNKNRAKLFGVAAGLMGVFTIANLAAMPNAVFKYENAKQSVSFIFKPSEFSFAYKF